MSPRRASRSPRARARPAPGPWLDAHFGGSSRIERLARALLAAQALPYKEVLEAFEFVERARRRVRAPVVADLCCGHGLAGLLYAVLHRDVQRVLLVDRVRPPSFDAALEALAPLADGLRARVTFHTASLEEAPVPPGAALLGVHACGARTDAILDRALALRGPVALLPCCHSTAAAPGPATLVQHLGAADATDIARTWRLHAAGYQTRWDHIPAAITPMNRVLLGWLGG